MHRDIKRFGIEGITDDNFFARVRELFEPATIDMMREEGYAPYLEYGPHFSTSIRKDGKFDFILSVYGIYVGEDEAWEIEGVADWGLIPFNIQQNKSNPSSSESE